MSLDEDLGRAGRHRRRARSAHRRRPGGQPDHERRHPGPSPDEDALTAGRHRGAAPGVAVTPELRQGIVLTVVMAVATAAGKLAVPMLIQQILDRGVLGDDGYRPGFVSVACAVTAALVFVLYVVSQATFLRLVRAAEDSLFGLRIRTFAHIHRLSIAEHVENQRARSSPG